MLGQHQHSFRLFRRRRLMTRGSSVRESRAFVSHLFARVGRQNIFFLLRVIISSACETAVLFACLFGCRMVKSRFWEAVHSLNTSFLPSTAECLCFLLPFPAAFRQVVVVVAPDFFFFSSPSPDPSSAPLIPPFERRFSCHCVAASRLMPRSTHTNTRTARDRNQA